VEKTTWVALGRAVRDLFFGIRPHLLAQTQLWFGAFLRTTSVSGRSLGGFYLFEID
jgi:hypothetical protein